jgi:hypothetical protein
MNICKQCKFSKKDFEEILSHITLGNMEVMLRYDGERPYLQIKCENAVCTVTGELTSWTGGKHMLSPYMCKTEVVRKAYDAYIAAVKHEADEVFKYKDVAIYDHHYSADALAGNKKIDAREDGMQGV